ncbi:MAG: response regulator [candidate division Zixibacteria bacterium]|nr:response regulator [candidate division Zixibacteria bacterium]
MNFRPSNSRFVLKLILLTICAGLPPWLLYLNLSARLNERARDITASYSRQFVSEVTGEIKRDAEELRNIAAGFATSRSFKNALEEKNTVWFSVNLNRRPGNASYYDGIAVTAYGGQRIFHRGLLPGGLLKRKSVAKSNSELPENLRYSDAFRIEYSGEIPLLAVDEIIPAEIQKEIAGIITLTRKLDADYFHEFNRRTGLAVELIPEERIPQISWSNYQHETVSGKNQLCREFYFRINDNSKTEYIILLVGDSDRTSDLTLRVYDTVDAFQSAAMDNPISPEITFLFIMLYIVVGTYLLYRFFGKTNSEVRAKLLKVKTRLGYNNFSELPGIPDKNELSKTIAEIESIVDSKLDYQARLSKKEQLYIQTLQGLFSADNPEQIIAAALSFLKYHQFGNSGIIFAVNAENDKFKIIAESGIDRQPPAVCKYIYSGRWIERVLSTADEYGSVVWEEAGNETTEESIGFIRIGVSGNVSYFLLSPLDRRFESKLNGEDLARLGKAVSISLKRYMRSSSVNSRYKSLLNKVRLSSKIIRGGTADEVLVNFVMGCRDVFGLGSCSLYILDGPGEKLIRRAFNGDYSVDRGREIIELQADDPIAKAVRDMKNERFTSGDGKTEVAYLLRKNGKPVGLLHAICMDTENLDSRERNLKYLETLVGEFAIRMPFEVFQDTKYKNDRLKDFSILEKFDNSFAPEMLIKENHQALQKLLRKINIIETVFFTIDKHGLTGVPEFIIPENASVRGLFNSLNPSDFWEVLSRNKTLKLKRKVIARSISDLPPEVKSCLLVPMEIREDSIELVAFAVDYEISEEDFRERILSLIASNLYTVSKNVWQFQKTRAELRRLKMLQRFNAEVNQALDFSKTLEITGKFLSDRVGGSGIYWGDADWQNARIYITEAGRELDKYEVALEGNDYEFLKESSHTISVFEKFIAIDDKNNPLEIYFLDKGISYLAVFPIPGSEQISRFLIIARIENRGLKPAEFQQVVDIIPVLNSKLKELGFQDNIAADSEPDEHSKGHHVQSNRVKALGEMAGGVVHDFNNILTSILGRVQLLLMQLRAGAKLPATEVISNLELVEKMTIDGSYIVRRINEFTRDNTESEFEIVPIDQIIKDALAITRAKWRDIPTKLGIIIELEMELEENSYALCRSPEMREVLTNLVINAVDAMPEGGTLRITNSSDEVSNYIEISDTGVGMDQQTLDKIFDPFFTTKGKKGTGLGLSVTHGIIEKHDGSIKVQSEKGVGTTFILQLPKIEEPFTEKSNNILEVSNFAPASILVIDDEDYIRDVLSELLETRGHDVVTASDGNEGLEKFKQGSFEVVITDLGMPGISGWEVAKGIKKVSPDTKVILTTGWGAKYEGTDYQSKGVDLLISKPFDMQAILNLIGQTGEANAEGRELENVNTGGNKNDRQ